MSEDMSELCRKVLRKLHPGWEELVGLPDVDGGAPPCTAFRRWLFEQPTGYAEQVLTSYDPIEISEAIEKFLAHKCEIDELERLYRHGP